MLKETYDAVFEKGVFRLLSPIDMVIPDGQRVRLTVETTEPIENVLDLAVHVFDGFSKRQIDEIEQIILDRRKFFGDRVLE